MIGTPDGGRAAVPRRGPRLAALGLLLLCGGVFLHRLGGPALKDPDEGRNAEVAREMLESGDLVTPTINGARYLDKPPAFFWVVAASLGLFGPTEVGARLPSALFAFAGVGLTVWFARRRLGGRAGLLAGALLGLTPIYVVFARTVIFDMMLTVCMTASVMAAYEAMEGEGRAARLAGPVLFAAAGLGTITKGPVALVLPLLVAVAWALVTRRPRLLGRLRFGAGLPIYALVVVPWVALASWRNPGFLSYALVGENLDRLAGNTMETQEPWHFYLQVLPGFFPWIAFALAALVRRAAAAIRGRRAPGEGGGPRRAATFAALWMGVIFVFFSLISSKRPSYVLPMAIPAALYVAGRWGAAFDGSPEGDEAPERDEAPGRDEARADLAAGAAIVALACLFLAVVLLAASAGFLDGIDHGKYGVILMRRPLFLGTAAGVAAAGVTAGVAVLLVRRARRPATALLMAALPVAVMVPLARAVLGYVEAARSSRPVSRFLAARLRPDDAVVCYEEYRPGLNFYLRRPIYLVSGPGRTFTSNYIKMHIEEYRGDPSFRLIPVETLRRKIEDRGSITYLLSPERSSEALRSAAGAPLRSIYADRAGAVFVPDR